VNLKVIPEETYNTLPFGSDHESSNFPRCPAGFISVSMFPTSLVDRTLRDQTKADSYFDFYMKNTVQCVADAFTRVLSVDPGNPGSHNVLGLADKNKDVRFHFLEEEFLQDWQGRFINLGVTGKVNFPF